MPKKRIWTPEEIAQIINKSVRTVKTKMIEMQEKGLITRIKGKTMVIITLDLSSSVDKS